MKATAKQLRVSPRKMGLVASLVRGRTASDALVILEHTPKRAAGVLREVVKSAVANAENNDNKQADNLVLETIYVGPSVIMKRFRPVSRGRAHEYRHRLSNVTIELSELQPVEKKPAKAATKPKKEDK